MLRVILGIGLAVLGLCGHPSMARADESQALGVYVSNLAGSGLTCHRQYESGWGYHLSGIGWAQGSTALINVGFALTREMDRRPWGRLYTLLGVGFALNAFTGEAGMPASTTTQVNLAPGLGASWGPFFAEAGMSVYHNPSGFGFGPSGGLGVSWWF